MLFQFIDESLPKFPARKASMLYQFLYESSCMIDYAVMPIFKLFLRVPYII